MRWDLIQLRWAQYRIMAKRRWLALTDDQLTEICGLKDRLATSLQSTYGISREVADLEIEAWCATFDDLNTIADDHLELTEATLPAASLQHSLEQRRRSEPRR